MSEPKAVWRVTWALEVLQDFESESIAAPPDVPIFRVAFYSQADAREFVAEVQRYLGGTLAELIQNGVQLKVKP